MANMRERFMAWLDGLDAPNASADQEAQIVSEHLTDEKRVVNTLPVASPQPPPPAAQPLRAADDDALRVRLAAVEAENQRLRLTGITETATRYAQDLFRDGRAMPSEQTAITAAYIRAALDDMYTPVSDGPTRVALIQASYAARESRRQILGELVGDDVLTLLHDKARGPKRSAEGDVPTAERTDELLGMTSLGRRTIEARNGNGTGAH